VTTPEHKVKRAVKKVLDGVGAYYHMAVPMGLGTRTVDFLICYKGRFIGLETKAPGEKPTALQELCMKKIREAGGETLVIDSVEMAGHLKDWLEIHTTSDVLE
jgi:hypothetical protein